jgi:hypothetical protein
MTKSPTSGRTGQLMLPGQAAAPDGPVDLTVMFVMHRGFRRDLAAFERTVPVVPIDDAAAWTALDERWNVFSRILHDHHSGEDAGLWPLLLARVDAAGDTAGRATLEAMSAEHARIDPLLDECANAFSRMARAPRSEDRAGLVRCLAGTRECLDAHLAHEERDAMRLVQDHLTQDDWERVSTEYFEKPLTKRQLMRVAAWVLQDLPPDGVERVRRSAVNGSALILLWRLFLRRPFDRRERLAFRQPPG